VESRLAQVPLQPLNKALRKFADDSCVASKLIDGKASAEQFAAIHTQQDVLKERINVLRECLHLYKDWNGC
jgi:hypothetical protein